MKKIVVLLEREREVQAFSFFRTVKESKLFKTLFVFSGLTMWFVISPNRHTFLIKFIIGTNSKLEPIVLKDRWWRFYLLSLAKRTGSSQMLADSE